MTKPNVRHHAVHPPSAVRPNLAVNPKPNYTPLETSEMPTPNPNPSIGLDAANMRLNTINLADDSDDECDPDVDDDCEDGSDDEDRRIPKHN